MDEKAFKEAINKKEDKIFKLLLAKFLLEELVKIEDEFTISPPELSGLQLSDNPAEAFLQLEKICIKMI